MDIDSIEIDKCSQLKSTRSALRFFKNSKSSSVRNIALHSGKGRGISVYESDKLDLDGNIVYNMY